MITITILYGVYSSFFLLRVCVFTCICTYWGFMIFQENFQCILQLILLQINVKFRTEDLCCRTYFWYQIRQMHMYRYCDTVVLGTSAIDHISIFHKERRKNLMDP